MSQTGLYCCRSMYASAKLGKAEAVRTGGNMGGMLFEDVLFGRQAAGWDAASAVVFVTQDSGVHTLRSAVFSACTLLYCAVSLPAKLQLHGQCEGTPWVCHLSPCADARCYFHSSITGLVASVCLMKLFGGGRPPSGCCCTSSSCCVLAKIVLVLASLKGLATDSCRSEKACHKQ